MQRDKVFCCANAQLYDRQFREILRLRDALERAERSNAILRAAQESLLLKIAEQTGDKIERLT